MPGSLPTTSRENTGGRVAPGGEAGRVREGWTPKHGCGTLQAQAASLQVKFVSSRDPSLAAHLWPREAWLRPRGCASAPGKATSRRALGRLEEEGPLPRAFGNRWASGASGTGGWRQAPALAERLGLGLQEKRPRCDPWSPE